MAKQKYKVRKKADSNKVVPQNNRPKTNFSVKQRMLLLVIWAAVCIGLYFAVAKVSFFFSFWIFIIIFMIAVILYFITSIKVGQLINEGKADSEECTKLTDRGKLLLIVMIPPVFVMIYDFVSSTVKMFM